MIERQGKRSRLRLALAVAALLGVACTHRSSISRPALAARPVEVIPVLDPPRSFEEGWEPIVLSGETRYTLANAGDRLALHAVANDSASGLIRRLRIDPEACPIVEWSWRVDRLQPGADLHEKGKDDVAASLFFLFGNPEAGFGFRRVPTIRYVWTNGTSRNGEVIDNPHLPGTVRSIVVRNADAPLGRWQQERRDLLVDFRLGFGREPDDVIEAVALLSDSDQTHESVDAWYGAARVLCRPTRIDDTNGLPDPRAPRADPTAGDLDLRRPSASH